MYNAIMKNNDNSAKFIGARIRTVREDMGMSQMDLAKLLGFESSTAISLIENGERSISTENLVRLEKIFHRSVKYFLGLEEEKVDLTFALRAEKDLSKEDQTAILRFIAVAKQNHKNGKRNP